MPSATTLNERPCPSIVANIVDHTVIIPTYRRKEAVRACLQALAAQTELPKQIILPDDTPHDLVKDVIDEQRAAFPKGVEITYIRCAEPPSLTRARNLALEQATGDVVTFFDSDTLPEPVYMERIRAALAEHPDAVGAMGFVTDYPGQIPWKARLLRTLMISHTRPTTCRLYHPLRVSYPRDPPKLAWTNWLFGCNMTFRGHIAKETRFCAEMERYSYGEDIEYSLQVAAKFGDSFLMVGDARIDHVRGSEGRITEVDLFKMRLLNKYYITYRHTKAGFGMKLKMKYQDLGNLLWYGYLAPLKSFRYAAAMLQIWWMVLRGAGKMRKGELAQFNRIYSFTR